MHDFLAMQVPNSLSYLDKDVHYFLLFQLPAFRLPFVYEFPECSLLTELHDYDERIWTLKEVVDLDDMRMEALLHACTFPFSLLNEQVFRDLRHFLACFGYPSNTRGQLAYLIDSRLLIVIDWLFFLQEAVILSKVLKLFSFYPDRLESHVFKVLLKDTCF